MPTTNTGIEADLQQAVVAALMADPELMSLLGEPRIFDRAPKNAAYPYLAVTNLTTRAQQVDTDTGYECRLTLNIWSNRGGRAEIYSIFERLRDSLTLENLTLFSHDLVNLHEEFSEVIEAADRRTIRGTIRLRAFLDG